MPDDAPAPASFPDPAVFARLAAMLRRRYGLSFGPEKASLAVSRLHRLAAERGETLHVYLRRRLAERGDDYGDLVDRLTTSYSGFFRGVEQFRLLRDAILPAFADRRRITVLSAGCATGEEPYSVLMTIADAWGGAGLSRARVIAGDVSRPALEKARRGVYPAAALESLSAATVRRFFLRGRGPATGFCRVKPALRSQVEFRRLNLVAPALSLPTCELILCANVMIYFDPTTRDRVAVRLAERLQPGGFLLLGPSESLPHGRFGLTPVGSAAYRKEGANR